MPFLAGRDIGGITASCNSVTAKATDNKKLKKLSPLHQKEFRRSWAKQSVVILHHKWRQPGQQKKSIMGREHNVARVITLRPAISARAHVFRNDFRLHARAFQTLCSSTWSIVLEHTHVSSSQGYIP
jgi:hypothetical protein